MRSPVSPIAWVTLLSTLLLLPAHAVDVRAIRLWAGPDSTRVVLDLSGSAQHSLQVLKNPDRVVLDVADARLASGARAAPAGTGTVKQVRMARRPSGELRIVLDLSRPIQAKSFLAAPNNRYGYRLVIDLGLSQSVDTPVKAEHGMKAVLTRNGDYFVPLRDRMRRARAQQADLFVSIHADSIRDRRVDGSSVYILSQRGSRIEASRWLAERENASDLIGGVSLDDKDDVLASVLLDLSQSASLSASQVAAERVLRRLNRVGEVRKPQVQQARFMVLKSPDIPSMLVETAYISNPQEERRLRGTAQQAKLAAAIHQGLRAYYYADPPSGTRIAELAAAGTPRQVLATAGGSGE